METWELLKISAKRAANTALKETSDAADIAGMARSADKEANPLYPVPKLMTQKELEKFYYAVADWSKK